MSKIEISKSINEEGWVIHLSLDGASLDMTLEDSQGVVQDIIRELKEIAEIEDS